MWSFKPWNEAFFLQPTMLGNRRYFSILFEYRTLNSRDNWTLSFSVTLKLNKIVYFIKIEALAWVIFILF